MMPIIYQGNSLDVLKTMPDNSIDLIITSPPYADQRKDTYGGIHPNKYVEWFLPISKELLRVLKTDGTCLIQTPFKDGETYEDFSIKTKEDRLKHFGQDDHVRIYSISGLKERLEKSGFLVDVQTFPKDDFFGLSENEHILVCSKK